MKMKTKYIFDIETSGLNGITDRITCISILDVQSQEVTSFCGPNEKKILQDFFSKINRVIEIIGFNSNSFDWAFIIQRTLINNVPVCSTFHKISKTDLRLLSTLFFTCYNKAIKGTLDQWSDHLGLGHKKTTGEQMIEFYKKGDYKSIVKHCEEDVKITYELYLRIINCGIIKNENGTKNL
jgi:predicted PolB exonuclease-like 3'-5' exonuclease